METNEERIWKPEEYSYEFGCGFIPKITSYLHEDTSLRPCMLVVPGGAYAEVSPTEGEPVARKFYSKGYNAFVLTYTTDMLRMAPLKMQPLNDISRAVRYIRKNAARFRVEEHRLALCGFSAGGHLCANLCVHFQDVQDAVYGDVSNRPDAAVLAYPVITAGEKAHRGSIINRVGIDAPPEELEYMSLEKHVTPNTPPCFLWATATDEAVPVENSQMFADACREKGVPCALHVFSRGRHGLSLADDVWANGLQMGEYTWEQRNCIIRKVRMGELSLPEEKRKAVLSLPEHLQFKDVPNPEVAVWPDLADLFLQSVMN